MMSIKELDDKLATPSPALIKDISNLEGDLLILGAGGKMGPSLAVLAKHAIVESGVSRDVICVSRFSDQDIHNKLQEAGIKTIVADLLIEKELQALPNVKNVIYMVGQKFGTSGNESLSWALNSYLPGRISDKYKNSSIVVFSTGNVYPFVEISSGGATEIYQPNPVGEYAQSCLGRERVFEYFSKKNDTPITIFRLNYAIDMRYGVLLEIAKAVDSQKPIDLQTGHVNVIWQGDANEIAIRCLKICSSPPNTLNVTGPETVSIRWLANEFGELLNKEPQFINSEKLTALLSNAAKCHQLFGYPSVSLQKMIEWTAEWVINDGKTLNKETHFQEREGKF